MDWYVIEYLYPESFKKFIDTMFPNVGLVSITLLQHFEIKNLYYFFEKQGVYLTIEKCTPYFWVYNISTENGLAFGNTFSCNFTRDNIEIEAFTDCFRFLDNKLRNKNEKKV